MLTRCLSLDQLTRNAALFVVTWASLGETSDYKSTNQMQGERSYET